MIDADHATAEVVRTYYDVLGGGPTMFAADRLRPILAEDLIFDGPLAGRRVGAEGFIRELGWLVETIRGLTMLYQLSDGDTAAALYDVELPGGPVRFAEFFGVGEGRIRTLRLLYDATEYRARGGR